MRILAFAACLFAAYACTTRAEEPAPEPQAPPGFDRSKIEKAVAEMRAAAASISTSLEGIKDEESAKAAREKVSEGSARLARAQMVMGELRNAPESVQKEIGKTMAAASGELKKMGTEMKRLQKTPYFQTVTEALEAGGKRVPVPPKGEPTKEELEKIKALEKADHKHEGHENEKHEDDKKAPAPSDQTAPAPQ
jgi:hypothetical protein